MKTFWRKYWQLGPEIPSHLTLGHLLHRSSKTQRSYKAQRRRARVLANPLQHPIGGSILILPILTS